MIVKPAPLDKHASQEVRAMVKNLEQEVEVTKSRVGKEEQGKLAGLQKMQDYEQQQEKRKLQGKQTPEELRDYNKWRNMSPEERNQMAKSAGVQQGYRQWGGQQGQQQGQQQPQQPQARHGIKQIIYDRNQMISPKLQKELGVGVHNMGDPPKQVIREGPNKQSWYAWFFGEPNKIQKSSWY
jgi:hypothetical protein